MFELHYSVDLSKLNDDDDDDDGTLLLMIDNCLLESHLVV